MKEKLINSEVKFKGQILELRLDTVELPNNKIATREVVRHPGAVSIVAFDGQNVLLVRQYRHPVQEVLWEIPAGKLDLGEEPLACAKRELHEETGYKAGEWKLLSNFFTTPGFSDENMFLYLATKLEEGEQCLDEDEFLSLERVPLEKALEMVVNGEIKDAKTIAGITLAHLYMEVSPALR